MWNDQQLIPLQFTPTACVPASQLDEVDWPFVFIAPRNRIEFVLAGVDLQERTCLISGLIVKSVSPRWP
jgi:hypothetical protein